MSWNPLRRYLKLVSQKEKQLSSGNFEFEVEGVLRLTVSESLVIRTIRTMWKGYYQFLKVVKKWKYPNSLQKIIPIGVKTFEETKYLMKCRANMVKDKIIVDNELLPLNIHFPIFSINIAHMPPLNPFSQSDSLDFSLIRIDLDFTRFSSLSRNVMMDDYIYENKKFQFSKFLKFQITDFRKAIEDKLQRYLDQKSMLEEGKF